MEWLSPRTACLLLQHPASCSALFTIIDGTGHERINLAFASLRSQEEEYQQPSCNDRLGWNWGCLTDSSVCLAF